MCSLRYALHGLHEIVDVMIVQ